jgi:uncharacterized protein YndB with AHSA1/START domain
MRVSSRLSCVLCVAVTLLCGVAGPSRAKVVKTSPAGFTIEHELILPVPPEEAFDAMTGDISGWWDHSFSEKPAAFYIEPKPGGGFYEMFDDVGNGVLHATVTYAHRGKMLRYEGPLGLAGNPFTMVMTFIYEPHEKGTRVAFSASSMGIMQEGWDAAVDQVWHHFLVEQLKPYVEAGRHRKR